MANYIMDYTNYLKLERRSSDNTVTSYVRDVTQFSHYLMEVEETELPHCKTEHLYGERRQVLRQRGQEHGGAEILL